MTTNKIMKKYFLITCIVLISASNHAQDSLIDASTDRYTQDVQRKIDSINYSLVSVVGESASSKIKIDSLFVMYSNMSGTLNELVDQINALNGLITTNVEGLKIETAELENRTSSLTQDLTSARNDVSNLEESSTRNSESINSVTATLSQNQQYILMAALSFLVLVMLTYLILNRKHNKANKELLEEQKKIFEKQIEDSQQLADWLSTLTTESFTKDGTSAETDHSFAKRVADEIIRITTNLSHMDSAIRGFKQLSASVRKLEQSLNSNGYEIENLLNKPYDNGMNLQANFVIDENLNAGESIITRIIKPQINYNGKLIQAAQVEVSQGE
jgi:uncharacterized protein YoxC